MKVSASNVAVEIMELIRRHGSTAVFSTHPVRVSGDNTFEVISADGQKFRVGVALIMEKSETDATA